MNTEGQTVSFEAWHLDKRVNVSHIIATLTLAASAFAWGSAIDRRVAVMEAQIIQAKADNERQDTQSNESLKLLREEMRDVRTELRGLRSDLQQSSNGQAKMR